MALIKLGAFITAISGKVGGQSFASSPSGTYIKNIGSYNVAKNTLTAQKLTSFSFIAGQWRLLLQSARDDWQSQAQKFPYTNRVGEQKIYSGYQLFIKFNGSLIECGAPFEKTPPDPQELIPLSGFFIDQKENSAFLGCGASNANTYALFKMSAPSSPGQGASSQNFKTILNFEIPSAGFSLDLKPNYIKAFGSFPVGRRYNFSLDLVRVGSGQRLKNVFIGSFILSDDV